jgi:shikimate 5-dehydrogenase
MDIPIEEARFVCLGGGGSASAAARRGPLRRASISVVDVNEAAAESLVRDINERFRPS